MSNKVKVVFHVHSWGSGDSTLTEQDLISQARKKKIDVIFICDHGQSDVAWRLKKVDRPRFVAGQEIRATEGEVIGIFLTQRVATGLSFSETVKQIRAQGGLVVLPHPCDRLRQSATYPVVFESHISKIDIVEVFNSRTIFHVDDRKAGQLACRNNLLMICGCDAHSRFELGRSYLLMDNFSSPSEFLRALKDAELHCHYSPLWVHLISKFAKIFR